MRGLFTIPAIARTLTPDEPGPPAGGLGAGSLSLDAYGRFRRWRLDPTLALNDTPVPRDRFYLWLRSGRDIRYVPLGGVADGVEKGGREDGRSGGAETGDLPRRRALFPCTWTDYAPLLAHAFTPHALRLESCAFSPVLPTSGLERSLPLYVIACRAMNAGDEPLEVALMLTWECAWPEPVADATFDFQHDNLCLTGSLGSPGSPNRQGIAVPDLHYAGKYLQGLEPWEAGSDDEELINDFAEDGELDPRVVRSTPHGVAAWLKFELEPGETKEAPFEVAWHFPAYAAGLQSGQPRYYTQFLGRRRPDNAVVWLAEQAFQHYGAETANYRYWLQHIEEWHRDASLSANTALQLEAAAALLEAGTVWTEDGRLSSVDAAPPSDIGAVWPDLAQSLRG